MTYSLVGKNKEVKAVVSNTLADKIMNNVTGEFRKTIFPSGLESEKVAFLILETQQMDYGELTIFLRSNDYLIRDK